MDEERNHCRKRPYLQDNYDENEQNKRKSFIGKREMQDFSTEQTVYRYLCPKQKAGNVIGIGGEIMKRLRADTGARVLIEDAVLGCEERIITISSSSKETNPFSYKKDYACPAQDALFQLHERLVEDERLACNGGYDIGTIQVTARLLIRSHQARYIIGKRGLTIKNIRRDSGARILIRNDKHIPICAGSDEELLEIIGDAIVVKEALFQISSLLHEYPSRSLDRISFNDPYHDSSDFRMSRDRATAMPCSPAEDCHEFTLRLMCPSVNIKDVIGEGGANINRIRQESGAKINLDCFFDEEDAIILISAKEFMGIPNSPTINAATQLQPSCSMKVESECDRASFVTRLLVQRSQVGSLIGTRGFVINEIRRATRASISIIEESLPCVASVGDAMVQICGDFFNVRSALIQVIDRLKTNESVRKGPPFASSHYMPRNSTLRPIHTGRSFEPHSQGHSLSSEHNAFAGSMPFEAHSGSIGPQVDGDN